MNVNKTAKRILIYGDSYTFGKIPGAGRYDIETRFTGILQKTLGNNYEVIEEGLRGRVIEGENAFFPYRNGLQQFDGIFGSHLPLDLIIFFLGTNDTNSGSQKSAEEIINGYNQYLEKINWWTNHLGFSIPKIIVVSPPNINEEASYKSLKDIFKGSQNKLRQFPNLLNNFAIKNNILFFDASNIVEVSEIDGIHLNEESNKTLGEKLAEFIKENLNK
jgi:lysophospholipase L1-like esterase